MKSYITAGHYFLIFKGRHLERSIKPVSAFGDLKGGVFFDVAYATKISVAGGHLALLLSGYEMIK